MVQNIAKHQLNLNCSHESLSGTELKLSPVFDWKVLKAPTYYKLSNEMFRSEDKFTLVRSDHPDITLGKEVGPGYRIWQNDQMLDWVNEYLTRDYLTVNGYGYFGYGEKIFVQCYNDFSAKVNNDDVRGYFLVQNAHGGGAIKISFCTIRVVCENTLSMAAQLGETVRISHTHQMIPSLKEVHKRIDLAKKIFTDETDVFRALERKPMTRSQFQDTLERQFAKELSNRKDKDPTTYPIIRASLDNWDMLEDLQHLDNNAWRGFNAFNYNYNHGYNNVEEQSAMVRLLGTGTYMNKLDQFKKLALTT